MCVQKKEHLLNPSEDEEQVLFINDVRRRSTLPQGPPCSTIDAERLSFRVRNGTGRFPLAMAAETLSSWLDTTISKYVVVPDRNSGTTQ